MVNILTLEASRQKFRALHSSQHLISETALRAGWAASEHIGQRLPLASGLLHHLLQMEGPAQLLSSVLLLHHGLLQISGVAVCPLHVELHVALLGEAHDAVVTLVGPLPCVLLHVHLQGTLLVEGFLTERAVEWPLSCVDAAVPLQLAWLGERLFAGVTFKHSWLLGAQ